MTGPAFNAVFAEIADKMPGAYTTWIFCFILAFIGVGCCRVSRWLYLLMVPVAGWLVFSGWREFFADSSLRDAIITELGHGYLIQAVSASFVPLVALLAWGIHDLARWRAESCAPPNGGGTGRIGNL
jgi:hypothetical protein